MHIIDTLRGSLPCRKNIGLTWGHFSDGARAVKCCLLYSEQCCRLPGTLPLLVVVQILLLPATTSVMYWYSRYRVGARECGFAIRASRSVLVHVSSVREKKI